jgi:GNAT superfamily N-acetyltransferase
MIAQFKPEDARACSDLIRACIDADASIQPEVRRIVLRRESPEAMVERARLFYVVVYRSEFGVTGVGGVDLNEIRLLYVSPPYQRRGIGRALLTHLEEMVPSALFPDVFTYSTAAAEGFYRACGYGSGGRHPFDFEGHELQTVFMTKKTG